MDEIKYHVDKSVGAAPQSGSPCYADAKTAARAFHRIPVKLRPFVIKTTRRNGRECASHAATTITVCDGLQKSVGDPEVLAHYKDIQALEARFAGLFPPELVAEVTGRAWDEAEWLRFVRQVFDSFPGDDFVRRWLANADEGNARGLINAFYLEWSHADVERDVSLVDLLNTTSRHELDGLLWVKAVQSGYSHQCPVAWDFWHYGRHAAFAQELGLHELAGFFSAAWQIEHYVHTDDPVTAASARVWVLGRFNDEQRALGLPGCEDPAAIAPTSSSPLPSLS